jgi:hypothetical protein
MAKIILLNLFLHIMITKCSLLRIYFFENWGCKNIHYEKFYFTNYNCKNPLNEFFFFSTYCDCMNLKDNLLKINYDCGNDHDIFLILQIAIIGILLMIFFPLCILQLKNVNS